MMKKKVNITDPNMLIPELPSPNDLKPFPTTLSIDFNFHKTCVRSISISPCGKYLASGDEDHNLVIWQITAARIIRKYKLQYPVIDCIEWCPSPTNCLLSASNDELVYIIQPELYSKKLSKQTKESFEDMEKQYKLDVRANDQKEKFVKWQFEDDDCLKNKMIVMKF